MSIRIERRLCEIMGVGGGRITLRESAGQKRHHEIPCDRAVEQALAALLYQYVDLVIEIRPAAPMILSERLERTAPELRAVVRMQHEEEQAQADGPAEP